MNMHKKIPFWGGMLYLSDMTRNQSKRNLLFGCVCAMIYGQYGFCIELAQTGVVLYGDGIFDEIIQYAVNKIKASVSLSLRLRFHLKEFKKAVKRILGGS